jgi:hypothetical protein
MVPPQQCKEIGSSKLALGYLSPHPLFSDINYPAFNSQFQGASLCYEFVYAASG